MQQPHSQKLEKTTMFNLIHTIDHILASMIWLVNKFRYTDSPFTYRLEHQQ